MTAEVEKLVAAGELAEAARVLGRPFEVEGVVVEGDRRGKALGFPTANLDVQAGQLLPPKGIYAGAALGHRAAISIGVNPHYGGTELRVEAHLLDFDGDLYGQRVKVRFREWVRGQERFDSTEALVEQMNADVEATRRILAV
jgi:riboflavin kinase/FMN adenylyltransferase